MQEIKCNFFSAMIATFITRMNHQKKCILLFTVNELHLAVYSSYLVVWAEFGFHYKLITSPNVKNIYVDK